MYRTSSTLVYNLTGQLVEFYPPASEVILQGFPTAAAAYTVFDGTQSNDDAAEFSGTATLDTVNTTVSSSSGVSQTNRRTINLTATTGIVVDRRYVVQNSNGQREIVVPSLVTASTIEVDYDLSFDYESADVFRGIRHTFTVDATFIQDASKINVYGLSVLSRGHRASSSDTLSPPYRVQWVYSTDETKHAWTYFDVARQQAKHSVTIRDFLGIIPDAPYHEPQGQKGQQLQKQIDAGWRRVQEDVRLDGKDVDAIREGPLLDDLVFKASVWMAAKANIKPDGWEVTEWEDTAMKDYKQTYNRALNGNQLWIDTGTAGGIASEPAGNLWLRS